MISLQTNVTSLMAQENLNVDNQFQSKTIQQLTSGYRINSSGDDAAGLAIANAYRSNVAELTQGVNNANNGTSQLQIVDGGLSNISTILDRLKTLATEASSSTESSTSRGTLNQEYAGLLTEINRQASNINLNAGGSLNTNLSVYIGGASTSANASVNIDLSGTQNAVDATSLGLAGTNLLSGGGVGLAGNTESLTTPGATFVVGTGGANNQTFNFSVYSGGAVQTVTATVAATSTGSTLSSVLSSLNSQLSQYGITAGTNSNGALQFTGTNAFTVQDPGTSTGTDLLTNEVTDPGADVFTSPNANDTLTLTNAGGAKAVVTFKGGESVSQALTEINAQSGSVGITAVLNAQGTGINLVSSTAGFTAVSSAARGVFGAATSGTVAAGGGSDNSTNYTLDGASTYVTPTGTETLQFSTSAGNATVSLTATDSTVAKAVAAINAQTASLGIFAVANAAGTGISLQSANSFTLTDTPNAVGKGFNGANATSVSPTTVTSQAPTAAATGNATSAIAAINQAIANLGLVQGSIGAGENKLQYATNLAQSQISSYSAAESQIRDANVAAEAADLTKAQVLVQTSVAALAQANSAPQSILKLLQ